MVEAEEAYRIGLVSAVVEPDQLFDDRPSRRQRSWPTIPTAVVRKIKTLLNDNTSEPDLNRVMEREGARATARSRRLPSHSEAVTAFLEKRPPVFNQ